MVTRPKFIESFQASPFPLPRHCSKSVPLLPYSYSPLFIFLHEPRVSRSDATPLYSRNKLPSARLGTIVPHRCFASSFHGPTTMTPAP